MTYPKWLYHKTNQPKVVQSEEEHAGLGEGWEETPTAFDQEQAPQAEEPKADENQTGKIDESSSHRGHVEGEPLEKMSVKELRSLAEKAGATKAELKEFNTKAELIAFLEQK